MVIRGKGSRGSP